MHISNKRPRFSECSVNSALHTETHFKLYNTDLYNHTQWNMSGTENNTHTAARQTPASNHHRDSLKPELGESMPNVLAPGDPTLKDHDGPRLLADCLARLISASARDHTMPTWHLESSRARYCRSIRSDRRPTDRKQAKQQQWFLRKRSPQPLHSGPNLTPIHHVRTGNLHDISADHHPGDPEMPRTVISSLGDTNANHKVLIDTNNHGHFDTNTPCEDWQSSRHQC